MKEILAILCMLFGINSATAVNYFVSNSGQNTNTGLSSAQAFLHIQHTVAIVKAGDTVFVENGTYAGFDVRSTNGTISKPIVYKANGNNVLINSKGPSRSDGINVENANYITIDGFIVNGMINLGNGIRLVNAHGCTVRNCKCDKNDERGIFTGFTDDITIEYNVCTNSVKEHGIYVSNSCDNPIIRFNECFGNKATGVHMNGDLSQGGDGLISNAQVYNNILHDNHGAAGINMDGVINPLIYNNLIYNNHNAQGIALFKQDGAKVTSGAKIYNNTIIVPSDGRWGILVMSGANIGTEIVNNIIINQHAWRGCVTVEDTSKLICDYNILNDKMSNKGDGSAITLNQWKALGFDVHSQLANTLNVIFADPSNTNYQLATGSQAIDAGDTRILNLVGTDIINVKRPQKNSIDIGAYELPGSSSTLKSKKSMWSIYPNPANGVIYLKCSDRNDYPLGVIITDLQGRVVLETSHAETISLSGIPAGGYVLKWQTQGGDVYTHTFVRY